MNEAITKMKTVPGFYRVASKAGQLDSFWCVVEVTAEGTVHQMTSEMLRDGVLTDEGWHDDVVVIPHTT